MSGDRILGLFRTPQPTQAVSPYALIDPGSGERYWRLPNGQKFTAVVYYAICKIDDLADKLVEERLAKAAEIEIAERDKRNNVYALVMVSVFVFCIMVIVLTSWWLFIPALLFGFPLWLNAACSMSAEEKGSLDAFDHKYIEDSLRAYRDSIPGMTAFYIKELVNNTASYPPVFHKYMHLRSEMSDILRKSQAEEAAYFRDMEDQAAMQRGGSQPGKQRPNNPGGFSQPATRAELDGDAGLPKLRL